MRARFGACLSIGLTVTSCSSGPGPRVLGNESLAIQSLRAIAVAQVVYSGACGKGGYAASLPVLGAPLPDSKEPNLPPDLAAAGAITKSGYVITLGPAAGATDGPLDCIGRPTRTSYYAKAEPVTFGETGTRSFATNPANTIWQLQEATAPREPLGAQGGAAMPVQ